MTAPSVPQGWTVTYWVDGQYWEVDAQSADEARLIAVDRSRRHGEAAVTNSEGLVASYSDGRLWTVAEVGL